MSQTAIRGILQARLATWAAARMPELPVLFENVRVTAEPAETHLRAYMMPATTLSPYLEGNGRRYIGIWQVSIFTPPGDGTAQAEQIAAELDALFPCTEVLTNAGGFAVQIMTPMSASTAQEEPGWHHVAVSCRYQAFATVT